MLFLLFVCIELLPVIAKLLSSLGTKPLYERLVEQRDENDFEIKRIEEEERLHIAENTARIPHPYKLADAEQFIAGANKEGEAAYLITLRNETIIGACGLMFREDDAPEIGYWLGVPYWNKGYATEALHALIDYAFTDLTHDALQAGARVTNPASRRVLEKCGFQWTGVGLYRINSIKSSAPIDRFRLERRIWSALKTWGRAKRVS